jgi:hypothetical protein
VHSADFAKKIPGAVAWKRSVTILFFWCRRKDRDEGRQTILLSQIGFCPESLSDLLPDFVSEFPLAKHTLLILLFGNIF